VPLLSRRHSSAPAAMKPCRSDAKSSPSSERYEVGHTARPRNLERFKFGGRRLSTSSLDGSCPLPLCHPHAIHGWTETADGTKTAASARRPVDVDVDVDVASS
jgi:hypothetical protein